MGLLTGILSSALSGLIAIGSSVKTAVFSELLRQGVMLGVKVLTAAGILDIERWTIDQYFEDLTKKAKEGKLRPAIGRDEDMQKLFTAMSKQTKSNVCITGEAGVGKTALIEGFAYLVANGQVPDEYKNVRVLKINMVDLIVGRSYISDSNCMARMKAMFAAVERYDKKHKTKTILVMDEFHQVVNAKVAELCKQNFDRDDFHCIAATTTEEYNVYIRPDAALERRFPELRLQETSEKQTIAILKERVGSLEKENGVKITDEAVQFSVMLPGRYMLNRHFPDKAIDILNSSVKNAKLKAKNEVTADEVREEMQKATGIPIGELSVEDYVKLATMEERLNSVVFGQEQAVKTVCNAVVRGRADLCDPNRPLGSFVFTGNSGVGKTMLAKELGREIGHVIRLDMSQYTSKSSFLELLFKDGELPREINKYPYSVILLDNINKASVETKDVIAGILDDGVLSITGSDHKLNFRNTYIVMTTDAIDSDSNDRQIKLVEELTSHLISRVDNVVWFNKLTSENASMLAKGYLLTLRNSFERYGYNIHFDDSIYDYLSNKEISVDEGARSLRKWIDNDLGQTILSVIINEKVEEGSTLLCSADSNGFKVEVKK